MKKYKFIILFVFLGLMEFSISVEGKNGFFELGYATKRPFQVESIFNYFHRTLYYNEETKTMEEFPKDVVTYPTGDIISWKYERVKVKFRIGYNFTYNLRIRFTFPYIYSDLLKTDSINQKIEIKEGSFSDFEVELKYDWFKRKIPLWNFWKSGTIYIAYMFDSGSDELLENYISMGEDSLLLDLRLEFLPYPEKLKELSLKTKLAYEFNGYKRPFAYSYSKSGWKDGNQFSYEIRISYIINYLFKVEGYYYGKQWYESVDIYGNTVEDTDENESGIGGFIKYRPFGNNTMEVYLRMWYPIEYKETYVSLINPEIGIKYTF